MYLVELYKRPLAALCGMVVHHKDYQAQGGIAQAAPNLPLATKIATAVLVRLGLGSKGKYVKFLETGNMFDRGEQLSGAIYKFLRSLDTYRP